VRLTPSSSLSQTYDKAKDLNYAADDAIRPWLKGFVDYIGYDKAVDLLDGVGDVSIAPPMQNYVLPAMHLGRNGRCDDNCIDYVCDSPMKCNAMYPHHTSYIT